LIAIAAAATAAAAAFWATGSRFRTSRARLRIRMRPFGHERFEGLRVLLEREGRLRYGDRGRSSRFRRNNIIGRRAGWGTFCRGICGNFPAQPDNRFAGLCSPIAAAEAGIGGPVPL